MSSFLLSKKQTWEFLTALKGRAEIPLKLEYLGDGAKRYLQILYSGKYKNFNQGETELIKKFLDRIIPFAIDRNIVYIGCGDGSKAIPIIKELVKREHLKEIHLIDISRGLLDVAEKNIKRRFPKIKIFQYTLDFEEGNFSDITSSIRKKRVEDNFYLSFGTTLGNLSNRERILTNFRESMTLQDHLCIGLELVSQDIGEVIGREREEASFQWLLSLLGELGIHRESGEFLVEYNHEKNQIETSFVLKESKEYRFADEIIYLEEGHKILLAISHKFTIAEMKHLFRSTGYKVNQFFTDKKYHYVVAIVSPIHWILEET